MWVGFDALVMPGVKVGDGAFVAARSVVTRDVPPYSVVGGNPASVVKQRFPDEVVAELLGDPVVGLAGEEDYLELARYLRGRCGRPAERRPMKPITFTHRETLTDEDMGCVALLPTYPRPKGGVGLGNGNNSTQNVTKLSISCCPTRVGNKPRWAAELGDRIHPVPGMGQSGSSTNRRIMS